MITTEAQLFAELYDGLRAPALPSNPQNSALSEPLCRRCGVNPPAGLGRQCLECGRRYVAAHALAKKEGGSPLDYWLDQRILCTGCGKALTASRIGGACRSCKPDEKPAPRDLVLGRRERMLATKYGLTLNDYQAMSDRQDGRCAICREPERSVLADGSPRPLSVDHDHETGVVRDLLCGRCNLVVGYIENSFLEHLSAARAYVARWTNGTVAA